jgi:hypothetical protein
MAKAKTKSKKAEPVYSWPFQSSQPRGGTVINYIAQLNEDGSLSCNCPGWIFAKKNQERACKHTRLIVDEAPDIFKKWKNGEELPLLFEGGAQGGATMSEGHAQKQEGKDVTKIKYGRFVNLDQV